MNSSTISKVCIECNNSFQASSKEVDRGNAKFCSLSCVAKYFNKHKSLNLKNFTCKECSLEFQSASNEARYCSQKCKNRFFSRKRKRRYDIPTNSCEICGWNKCTCDVHHIQSISSNGTNDKTNLISLCPNCHRMANFNLISKGCLIQTISKRTIPSSDGIQMSGIY